MRAEFAPGRKPMQRVLEPPISEIAERPMPVPSEDRVIIQRSTDRCGPSEPAGRSAKMSYSRSSAYFALMVTLYMSLAREGRADSAALEAEVRKRTAAVEEKLIAWRRDIHQHPELGDQETRTATLVAEHLRGLGLEVRTDVARTGVVGILKGGKPGRTVALRADMDALPVQEPEGLPFASKETAEYFGKDGPRHARLRARRAHRHAHGDRGGAGGHEGRPAGHGDVHLPARGGGFEPVRPSSGKSWGAKLMLEEGLFEKTKPDAVFAVHVMPGRSGEISYRSGPTTASSDTLEITVTGKQGHGGMPWNTVDPITTSALVISGLQTVVSRKANLTDSPVVVTIGTINGGTGPNIVPETVADDRHHPDVRREGPGAGPPRHPTRRREDRRERRREGEGVH